MKTWMTVVALAVVMGLAGAAEAKGVKGEKKNKGDKGVHGKITAVDDSSITVSTGGKKNPHDVTVKVDKGTTVTIDGAVGSIAKLSKGEYVTVTPGTGTATKIDASTTGGKQGKKAKKNK